MRRGRCESSVISVTSRTGTTNRDTVLGLITFRLLATIMAAGVKFYIQMDVHLNDSCLSTSSIEVISSLSVEGLGRFHTQFIPNMCSF